MVSEVRSPDDVSKATTPNAIRGATDERLDHLYNVAHGHLTYVSGGQLEQTKSSIRAIVEEQAWRKGEGSRATAKLAVRVAMFSALVAAGSLLVNGLWIPRIRALEKTTASIPSLESRIAKLEHTSSSAPRSIPLPPTPASATSPKPIPPTGHPIPETKKDEEGGAPNGRQSPVSE